MIDQAKLLYCRTMSTGTSRGAPPDTRALQDIIVALVRAFGLEQPERPPSPGCSIEAIPERIG